MKQQPVRQDSGKTPEIEVFDYKPLISIIRAGFVPSGEIKIKVQPTMLLKTNDEKMSVWVEPTMLMKTQGLSCR
jgi:hypothetical protein